MSSYKNWSSKYPDSWFSCIPGINGFLPIGKPLDKLPKKYDIINSILDNMKISNLDGYLNKGILADKINSDLPVFNLKEIDDVQLLSALQRDYSFLASAYSLETCHNSLVESDQKHYGIARDLLPPQLSIPLITLSEKNNTFPWLDYAYGYGLNNAILQDGMDPTNYNSYKTIRTFNGHESEQGFINVHVAMVAQSPMLLKYQEESFKSLSNNDRDQFNINLHNHYKSLHSIVNTLQQMWKASNYKEYLSFRTFIMGQIGNEKCYPTQQIKYDTGTNIELHSYRGETGAQDSIIPSVDSFLSLNYPVNKLTEYLFDLRKYRPKDHQEYIDFVKQNSNDLKLKEYCLADSQTSLILLKNLNCLRMFRKKHWNLTKKYIIQTIKHPVATGGTPITTWLPNQLGSTLEYMEIVVSSIDPDKLNLEDLEFYNTISIELSDHIQMIMDEVKSMQHEFTQQNHQEFLKR